MNATAYRPDVLARFWAKVHILEVGCWLWDAARNGTSSHQYGAFWLNGGLVRAHRFAYELLVGPIPDGMELDHVKDRGCSSTLCVNPAHLEPVAHRENVVRGNSYVAKKSAQTLCIRGHGLELKSDGTRWCRSCFNANARARYRKEPAS